VSTRSGHIRNILQQKLKPQTIEITDDSARHAGHAGARESGGGHFSIDIVSGDFAGLTRIQRHRMVYEALKDEFGPMIHALSIQAMSPEEGNSE